jgi:hypothetical protein
LKGLTQPSKEVHEEQQLLTKPEKEALVKMCSKLTREEYPTHHNVIKEIEEMIRLERVKLVNTYDSICITYPPLQHLLENPICTT